MDQKKKVYEELKRLGISYSTADHPAVYTIEDMDALAELPHKDAVVKNLFLRDANGKRHFIIVMDKAKKADLKHIREILQSSALSFASEERLMKYMGLTKGSVTPLGILNDESRSVEVVLDRSLVERDMVGVHPNDNTSTVFLSISDLCKVIEAHGNAIRIIDI